MIPIRDNVPRTRFPFFMWIIICANVYVFYQQVRMPPPQMEVFIRSYSVIPEVVTNWWLETGRVPYGAAVLPLFTSMFLHGSFGHILGNMWSLMIFGDNVEGHLGHLKFLALYILGGVFAALAQVYAQPTSDIPTLGASGAIAAVMGAYFVYFPRASVQTLIPIIFRPVIVAIPAWIFLIFWFGMQVFSGISTAEGPGVAWWAHAGGFGIGVLGAMAFRR